MGILKELFTFGGFKNGVHFDGVRGTASPSLSILLAHDIHNRAAQGILNRTLESVRGLTKRARTDLDAALAKVEADGGAAILRFADKYRLQLARLLTVTEMAAVLEGAREVAAKVPTIATFAGAASLPPSLEPAEALDLVEELAGMGKDERARRIYDLPGDQQTYAQHALAAREAGPPPVPPRFPPPEPFLDDEDAADVGSPEGVHLLTIRQAAAELAGKNVLTREGYDALSAAARAKAFAVAGVDAEETLTKIRDTLAANVQRGADHAAFRKEVLDAAGTGTFLSPAHEEVVFRTNIQGGFSDGQMAVLNHPQVRSGFPYAEYDAIHDDRVRADHLALEKLGIDGTNVYRIDDPVFQLFRPPNDYNCVLPGNVVSGMAVGALKTSYSGYAVEILTANGASTTLTIHHPVLTKDGFVPAGQLKKGHNLLCHLGKRKGLGGFNNVQHGPALIEDVFESFDSILHSEPLAAFDFDGDEKFMVGKVDKVFAYALLRENMPSQSEGKDQVGFVPSNSGGVQSAQPLDSSILGHPRPLEPFGGALATNGNPARQQSVPHDVSAYAHQLRNRILRLARRVEADDLIVVGDDAVPYCHRLGLASELDTVFSQPTPDGVTLNPDFTRELLGRFSSSVSSSKVIHIRHFWYSGPVYDLETVPGYFTVNRGGAASIIIRNCRCGWTPMTVKQAAHAGIGEAQRWLDDGVEPSPPAHVPMPSFQPPEKFRRAYEAAPLSIRLSMQPLAFAFDPAEKRDEGGKWTKDGDGPSGKPEWKYSDELPGHDSWRNLEAEEGYVYHATNKDNAGDIQADAMRPHRPSYGTRQRTWPDRSTAKRIYLTDKPATAWQFAPEDGHPALLRVKRHKLFKTESGTGDIYLEGKTIRPDRIEILTKDGWKPLKKKAEEPALALGDSLGGALGQGTDDLIAGIISLLFDTETEAVDAARRLVEEDPIPVDAALALWGHSIPKGTKYAHTSPGPGWVHVMTGPLGGKVWAPPGHAAVATYGGYPTAVQPPALAATGGGAHAQGHKDRLAKAVIAHDEAMSLLENGDALADNQKKNLAKHLSVMSRAQLKELYDSLGGTIAIVGSQRQPWVHAVKAILAGGQATPLMNVESVLGKGGRAATPAKRLELVKALMALSGPEVDELFVRRNLPARLHPIIGWPAAPMGPTPGLLRGEAGDIADHLMGPAAPGKPAKAAAPVGGHTSFPFKSETVWDTGDPRPGTLNGIAFAPAPPKFWENVKDVDVAAPPLGSRHTRAGILIVEPDGRVWICKPTNGYGKREYTLPGGTVEKGLTDQQNALKETWEETGIQCEITGYVGDFDDANHGDAGNSTRTGRLYIGRRVGGAPWDAKIEPNIIDNKTGKPAAESSSVVLVTPERAAELLHRTDDMAQIMAVNPIKIDAPVKGKGSEPLKKFNAAIAPRVEHYKADLKARGYYPGVAELNAVQEIRGFNKTPEVVSKKDFDALLAKGDHIEVLRGVESNGGRSASKLADEFRTGQNFPGHGVFGAGTYTDSATLAQGMARGMANVANRQYSGHGTGAVLRIAIPKSAKIIKVSELEKKVPSYPDSFEAYPNHGRHDWLGIQAALAGYDAIHMDGNSVRQGNYGNGYYVILNRGAVVVQKEDATGHIIK